MDTLGPLEVVVLSFPGTEQDGKLLAILEKVEAKPDVRVLDVAVVRRFADGSLKAVELAELPPEVLTPQRRAYAANHLLDEEDLVEVADLVQDPDTSTMTMVIEHLWEKDIVAAVSAAGGAVVSAGRIPAGQVEEVMAMSGTAGG